MTSAPIIHIGGWPGAGKRAIGTELAKRMGGRLIDNHIMLDAARAIYERGTLGSSALREEVRAVLMSHAVKLPPGIPIILTDALANEAAAIPLFQYALDLARDRNAPLHCFVLDLSDTENLRRLQDSGRTGRAKLRDPEVLKHIRANDELYFPENAHRIDVTDLSISDAAECIWARVERSNA
ncbi:MAG: nucleoside kinase [Pseudomonadota bacterium]